MRSASSSSCAHYNVDGLKTNQFSYATFMGRGRWWERWLELGNGERRSGDDRVLVGTLVNVILTSWQCESVVEG